MSATFFQQNSPELFNTDQRWLPFLIHIFLDMVLDIVEEIHCMEQFFINLHTIYAFICQVCFFILCDAIIDRPDSKLDHETIPSPSADKHVIIALTSILFYSVFAYFAFRIREICRRNRITVFTSMPSMSNYLKWFCKIILEWSKAIVVVLCLREQGIRYEPKLLYSIITFVYYLCTEKIFLESVPALIEYLNIEKFDNLEHLYIPLAMNISTIVMGCYFEFYNLFLNYSGFVFFSFYFIIYLRIKDAYFNQWKILKAEKETYQSFRTATKEDIEVWADICAVCLNTMSRAKITPCNHLFHPMCLKQCLKTSFYCPLCKQHFMEPSQRAK